jgi:hypothetical protein
MKSYALSLAGNFTVETGESDPKGLESTQRMPARNLVLFCEWYTYINGLSHETETG